MGIPRNSYGCQWGAMKVKKKLEVFTAPIEQLLAWHYVYKSLLGEDNPHQDWGARLLRYGEIKEVRLIHNDLRLSDGDEVQFGDEIEFTICSPEVQPAELVELRAKKESAALAVIARYRRGEITSLETLHLEFAKVERGSSDFKDFSIEVDYILGSHLGRLPHAGEKITKVELANDGVEFTMVRG